MSLQGKHILVGISGGIAAYKIPELIRTLVKSGAEVRVTTTRHALEFVTELTLQTVSGHAVYSDVFAAINEHATEHISLPEWCDMMIVAPTTANVLGKMASGIADDALTTTLASCAARKPIVLAPAMNDKMWDNPATQQAVKTLRSWQNIRILEPAEGPLACGTVGKGRMPEIEVLHEAVEAALTEKTMTGKRVLITAGPTQEQLDPVRYLSNYSTGKMGYALAHACARRGAEVTLVSGPSAQQVFDPEHIRRVDVRSAEEMCRACVAAWSKSDMAILCAAVADFAPEAADKKIKKQPGQTELTLRLHTTPDIARTLGESKRADQKLVGFALETDNEETNAQQKMATKNMDAIILNSLRHEGAGFGYDTNQVTIFTAQGVRKDIPLQSKTLVAEDIINGLND